jgi:hypothetical protein
MAEQTTPASLITNAGALGILSTDTVANLPASAQLGVGVDLPNIDGATPLVMAPLVAIVTHMPTMFNNLTNFPQVLKALIEQHAKSIDGVEFQYNLESQTSPAGHDGQMMTMPTDSRRSSINPSFTFQELTGNLVWNFFKTWIQYIKDPDTQAALYSTLTQSTPLPPMLWSTFTMDVLFIQYDPTMRPENIIDGFYGTCMWPYETGNAGWKREIGINEMPTRTIPFHGIVQHNANTKAVAIQVAQTLNLHQVNYQFSTPVATGIESDLASMGIQLEATTNAQAFTSINTGTGQT